MEANRYITVAYKLYSIEDGERNFEEEATTDHPFQFISDLNTTLESFENQVRDLKPGDTFDFTISCEQAYGPYNDEHRMELPKDVFVVNGKFDAEHIVPGAVVPMMTAEGQRVNGTVEEVTDNNVVMDFNHPLAGCDLNFVGSVVENRAATNDEINEMLKYLSGDGGCGCGCGDHGCGDHDCGDDGGCCGGGCVCH